MRSLYMQLTHIETMAVRVRTGKKMVVSILVEKHRLNHKHHKDQT